MACGDPGGGEGEGQSPSGSLENVLRPLRQAALDWKTSSQLRSGCFWAQSTLTAPPHPQAGQPLLRQIFLGTVTLQ